MRDIIDVEVQESEASTSSGGVMTKFVIGGETVDDIPTWKWNKVWAFDGLSTTEVQQMK